MQDGVRFQDALSYLAEVKRLHADRPHVYNEFLDIMKSFKNQELNTDGVIERVKTLFAGQPALLHGFNVFLPPGHRVEVEEEPVVLAPEEEVEQRQRHQQAGPVAPPVALDQARDFVKLVKFTTSPHTYKTFLELLHSYHKEQHSIQQVHDQVALLFADRPDLMSGFRSFLPDPAAVPNPATAQQQPPRSEPHSTLEDSLSSLRLDDPDDRSRVAPSSTTPGAIRVVMPVAGGDDDGSDSVDLRPSITFALGLECDQFSVDLECGGHSLPLQAEQLGSAASGSQERRRYAVQLPLGSELRRLVDPAAGGGGGARIQAKLVVRDRHFGELLQQAIVLTHGDV